MKAILATLCIHKWKTLPTSIKFPRHAFPAGSLVIINLIFCAQAVAQNPPPEIDSTVTERLNRLEFALVPVGAIVPYFPSTNLPSNWVLCDGAALPPVPETTPELFVALDGFTPDLRGQFVRGVSTGESAGATNGGTINIPAHSTDTSSGNHTHRLVDHHHSLPSTTGSIANGGADPGPHSYSVRDNGNYWGNDRHIPVDGGSAEEGHHRHTLGGDTGESNPRTTTSGPAADVGDHGHSIPAFSVENVTPSYVAMHYIIRIR